jgi:hypothetical protein
VIRPFSARTVEGIAAPIITAIATMLKLIRLVQHLRAFSEKIETGGFT